MDVVDEQGRLFGLVDVIDAPVVLLLASVLLAGVALLLQDPQPETDPPADTETRYATISFGPMPADVTRTIDPGEDRQVSGGGRATITDRYRVRRPDGTAFVVVRTARTPLVLEATVPTAVASRLRATATDPGGTVRGATVDSVTVLPAADPRDAVSASAFGFERS